MWAPFEDFVAQLHSLQEFLLALLSQMQNDSVLGLRFPNHNLPGGRPDLNCNSTSRFAARHATAWPATPWIARPLPFLVVAKCPDNRGKEVATSLLRKGGLDLETFLTRLVSLFYLRCLHCIWRRLQPRLRVKCACSESASTVDWRNLTTRKHFERNPL